jgi:hypothetical protein
MAARSLVGEGASCAFPSGRCIVQHTSEGHLELGGDAPTSGKSGGTRPSVAGPAWPSYRHIQQAGERKPGRKVRPPGSSRKVPPRRSLLNNAGAASGQCEALALFTVARRCRDPKPEPEAPARSSRRVAAPSRYSGRDDEREVPEGPPVVRVPPVRDGRPHRRVDQLSTQARAGRAPTVGLRRGHRIGRNAGDRRSPGTRCSGLISAP